jgi:hypothetical protein
MTSPVPSLPLPLLRDRNGSQGLGDYLAMSSAALRRGVPTPFSVPVTIDAARLSSSPFALSVSSERAIRLVNYRLLVCLLAMAACSLIRKDQDAAEAAAPAGNVPLFTNAA